jgi:hypothetical protein
MNRILKASEQKTLPLTDSQVISEFSRVEPSLPSEDAKEKIEAMKAERTCPGFIKAVKEERDLWTIFLEHFHSEDAFTSLLERKKYASALSGVMKMIVDFYSLQEQSKKAYRLKQEIEVLEKHKAFLMNVNSLREAPKVESVQRVKASDKYKNRDDTIVDTRDGGDHENLRSFVGSKYGNTEHTKKDPELEKIKSLAAGTGKKVLPTYDMERLQKIAMEAESESLQRNEHLRISKDYKPALKYFSGSRSGSRSAKELRGKASKTYDYDSDGVYEEDKGRPDSMRGEQDKYGRRRLKKVNLDDNYEPNAYESNGYDSLKSPISPSRKFEEKRQEYKKKKNIGASDSESPSPNKEEKAESERPSRNIDRDLPFDQKMQAYDYSHIRRGKDNGQQTPTDQNPNIFSNQSQKRNENKEDQNQRGDRSTADFKRQDSRGNGKNGTPKEGTPLDKNTFGKYTSGNQQDQGKSAGTPKGQNQPPTPKQPASDRPTSSNNKQKDTDKNNQEIHFDYSPNEDEMQPSPNQKGNQKPQNSKNGGADAKPTSSKLSGTTPTSQNGKGASEIPSQDAGGQRKGSQKSFPEWQPPSRKDFADRPDKKPLVPLVPDADKKDIYTDAQKDQNQKDREKREKEGVPSKLDERRSERNKQNNSKEQSFVPSYPGFGDDKAKSVRSGSGSRGIRDRSKPGLDNKNYGYKPAFTKEPKNFLIEMGIPDYNGVQGSGYGKIEPKKRSVSSKCS